MTHKNFTMVVGIVFIIIAALHALRLIYGWQGIIGSVEIPFWASWVALIISGYLGYQGIVLGRK